MGIVQRVHFSFQICAIMFLKWNNRRSHLLLDIDITKNKEAKNKIKIKKKIKLFRDIICQYSETKNKDLNIVNEKSLLRLVFKRKMLIGK